MSLAYTFREILAKRRIEKFNPYHGPDGRFTTGSGATSFTIRTKDPSKQGQVGSAVVAEAANQIRNLDHEESRIISPDGRMLKFTSGGEHEVAMTVGDKRENAPGAIMMHNHPNGGTFSSADLHDLGYGPQEMRAVAPEGDYVMRSIDQSKTPDWTGLRDGLEAAESKFKEPYQLRNEIFEQKYRESYNAEVNSVADKWVKQKESGASQDILDATYQEFQEAETAWNKKHPKEERQAEADRAYVKQWHDYYVEHAKEHGIEYVFEPQIKKYNHNHDPATGRFTTGNGGGRDMSAYGAMVRKDPPPKNTIKAYKAFIVKDGKLYPPMVANPGAMDTPVGVWLDAQEGTRAGESKTGRPQVKAGGKGTKGGSGQLAYRPGWHLGDIPLATQFYTKNKETGEKEMYPNLVFAECEIAADHNYQGEAMSYGYTENGKFRHSYAGLPKIPKDGFYTYRTNPDPTTRPWYITGAMKVGRILTDDEANKIIRDSGNTPMKRKDGPLTKEKLDKLMNGKVKKGRNPNGCGVLVVQDGKVLIGTRMDGESKGQICGPGGHVESGESTIEAARREAFEEFGILCHDLKPLERQDGGREYGKSDVFLCTKFSGTPKTDEEEMTKPRWADPGELTENLFPPFEQSLKLLPNIEKHNENHDPKTGRFTFATFAGKLKQALGGATEAGYAGHADYGNSPFGDAATGETDSEKPDRHKEEATPRHMSGEPFRYESDNKRGHLEVDGVFTVIDESGKKHKSEEVIAEELDCSLEKARKYQQAVEDYTCIEFADIRKSQRDGNPTTKARLLDEYAEKAPQWDGGEIYRGCSGREQEKFYKNVAVGDVVDMGGTSSWSSDFDTAAEFANDGGVLFQVDNPTKGTSIRHLSAIPRENEVLVSSHVTYRVTSIGQEDDLTVIHLAQCKLPTTVTKSFMEVLLEKFNLNHYPAGSPKGGQFAPGKGGNSGGGGGTNGKTADKAESETTFQTWLRVGREYGDDSPEAKRAKDAYMKEESEREARWKAERREALKELPDNFLEGATDKATHESHGDIGVRRDLIAEKMEMLAEEMGQRNIPADDKKAMCNHREGDSWEAYGYFYSSNSRAINDALRENPADDPFRGLRDQDIETINTLDRYMKPVPETIHLARMMSEKGMSSLGIPEGASEAYLNDLLKGKVIENKGYSSTSYDLAENRWTGSPLRLYITAPKGTPLMVSPHIDIESGFPSHAEVLLARGTALKVTSVKYESEEFGLNRRLAVECEVIL